ncbi:MAG: DUF3822 family protein [Chitinophagaceae bacterium]|nr:DUF3822 family protein [Chitinophagaceae bacterium]
MPVRYFRHEEAGAIHAALFGKESSSNVVSELIAEWQLHNVYSLPVFVQQWMAEQYQAFRYFHQHTIALRNLLNNESGLIQADFCQNSFSIVAGKGNKLLLAQTYFYESPSDALYYLLKICQEFSLLQQDVQVQLSGFIDKESSLYRELHQYFIHISFRDADTVVTAENPAHFFTSLNDLARCAL